MPPDANNLGAHIAMYCLTAKIPNSVETLGSAHLQEPPVKVLAQSICYRNTGAQETKRRLCDWGSKLLHPHAAILNPMCPNMSNIEKLDSIEGVKWCLVNPQK